MIRSMTGFGRGRVQTEELDLMVEVKALNHRYCDIYVKAPRIFSSLEDKCRDQILQNLARGKVEVHISFVARNLEVVEVEVDQVLAESYIRSLRKLQVTHDITDDISVSMVAKFPEVVKVTQREVDEKKLWSALEIALTQALELLVQMRTFEGEKLSFNVKERVQELSSLVEQIKTRSPQVPKDYQEKCTERLAELLPQGGIDAGRIAMEVALLADRCNIDEEIERLTSHMAQFLQLLDGTGAVGRRLDFLVQEMNREVNTIGSKANDLRITGWVVSCKSEIEKIREQIQNIE